MAAGKFHIKPSESGYTASQNLQSLTVASSHQLASGPPPGLGIAAPPAAALPPNPFGANGSQQSHKSPLNPHSDLQTSTKYERPSDCPRIYSRGTLLAFSASTLVVKPAAMAPLREWFGEGEAYHPRRENVRRAHAEDAAAAAAAAAAHGVPYEEGANNGGIIGGALGGFAPRREGAGARFGGRRNEDRERSEGLRLGEVGGRRVAPAGKNPFGQISASGTFKPAGTPGGGRGLPRDGNPDALGDGRRGMGERSTSYGKDRMRELLPDDRRRDPARERRRGDRGLDAEDSREDGEIIDSPRVRRTGGADTASDWRRPGDRDRAGPFSGLPSDRLRPGERRGAQRAGGAPWTGDADDNPAWLEDDSESLPVDNRAPFGQFGSRRKDSGDPLSQADGLGGAVDSIQAFKAQMKERERRERLARGEPEPAEKAPLESHADSLGAERHSSHEYPFGSDAASQQSELDAIRAEMMAAANQRSASGNSMFDSISNSHGGPGAEGQAPPGLPGRSSRFARFFDGRGAPPRDPQAAALAAQQKMLESMGAQPAAPASEDKESSSIHSPKSPPNASSSSINISELFSKSSIRDKADGTHKDASGKNVSEADQQSMQKLMAMLQGGGGGSGTGTPTSNKDHGNEHVHHHQRTDTDDRLKELLGGGGQARHSDHLGDRLHSIVSPGLSSAEAHGHGMEARSPLPYPQQQHQRESSTSSGDVGHNQHLGPQHQHQHQQPHESQQQFPQYQQQLQQQQRSDSPAMGGGNAFSVGSPTSPGAPGVGSPGAAPGMGGFGGFPGAMAGRPPPPGMDPRMMARPPMGAPGFQQLPPHLAASLGLARGPMPPGMANMPPPPPMGVPGPRGPNGGFPGFAPFPGGRPPPPGMPPQLYQQLMSMPPHIQQQVLAGQGFPPGMPPPPGSPYDMPNTQGGPVGGAHERRSQSPAQFPYYAQGPGGVQPPASPQQHQPVAVGAHAINGANLMALLSGGRNTPTN